MILVVDNYDSFTFNLVQALEAGGAPLLVARNDAIDTAGVERAAAGDGDSRLSGIVISPGPGDPTGAGISLGIVGIAARRGIPLLGVCLGHQCIGAAFGADIVRAPTLVHGEASRVEHDGLGLLAGLPSPFEAGRYHSLCIDGTTLPEELRVSARTAEGVVMGVRHRSLPIEGVQFHPESVLTPEGAHLLANFLRKVGEGDPDALDDAGSAGFAFHGVKGGPRAAAGAPR